MALRALSIAATGGRALMGKIDTIANNLANVNTTGFKSSRANFADLFYQHVQRAGFGEPGVNQNPTGISFGTGVKLVSTDKNFRQGDFTTTDQDLDVAIDGEGFLRVTLPNGGIAFTRDGNLRLDSKGNLVTFEGYALDPQINVPQNVTRLFIDQTGRIQGLDPQNPDNLEDIGQLELTRFINPSGLTAVGNNLYVESPAAGNRIDGEPGSGEGFGSIRQNTLEGSNVDIIKELVDLISAQRAFETNAKSIESADEILRAINGLRR